MPKRRSRGEGTIYQRPDGLWCAQITLPDGKRKTHYNKVQKVVRDWLTEQRQSVSSGDWSNSADMTLGAFLERYLADTAAKRVRPQTLLSYEQAARIHIIPALGKMKLAALQPQHIQQFYSGLTLAPGSVNIIHGVLRQALKQAEAWNMIGRSPMPYVRPPKAKGVRHVRMLTEEEYQTVLQAWAGHWMRTATILSQTTGMRRGEIVGLHWPEVDLENKFIHVRYGVVLVGRETVLAEPKTEKANRKISLPQKAIDALIEHKRIQTKPGDLLFPSRTGGLTNPETVTTLWGNLMEKLGLQGATFHGLRHLHGTILMEAGISAKVVQERLGHATVGVTLGIYSHVTPKLERAAADVIDQSEWR